jgi:hypothetical protein
MMDNLFFGGFMDPDRSQWGFSAVLNGLTDKDSTFNIVYEAVINNPTYVILSDGDNDRKIQILNKMLRYFESMEEYEKCYKLLRVKKAIETEC